MSVSLKNNDNRPTLALIFILFVVLFFSIIISYSNSVYSPFVLDDYHSFISDPRAYVHNVSLHSLLELKNTTFGYSRIIPQITFAIDHLLNRGSIIQYHITNITIHILTAIAVFFLTKALLEIPLTQKRTNTFFSTISFSFFVALLWALNPIQTNAVTYIVQRMASLCAFFYISSVAFYIHARLSNQPKRELLFCASALFAAAAFFSKENSATLPVTLLLVEFTLIAPDTLPRWLKNISPQKWLLLILFCFLLLPLLFPTWQQIIKGYDTRPFTLAERLLTELRVVAWYLSLLVLPLPSRMCLDHEFAVSTSLFSPVTTSFAMAFHLTLLLVAIKNYRKRPLLSVGIAWFYINLAIESTFVPLELVFEHRLYLPSFGFFLVLMYSYDTLCYKLDKSEIPDLKKMSILLLIMLAATSSLLTTLRNNDWKDSLSIYHDTVTKYPLNPRAAGNYALALSRVGLYDESSKMAKKSINLGRKNLETYITSSNILLNNLIQQGKKDELLEWADKTIKGINSDLNGIGYYGLMLSIGNAYEINEHYDKALSAYQKGIKFFSPFTTDLHPSVTILYNAISNLFSDIATNPDKQKQLQWTGDKNDVNFRLIDFSLRIRRYEMAQHLIESTLKTYPDNEKLISYRHLLDTQLAKNHQAVQKADIQNHQPYKDNFSYRLCMDLISFISRRYQPLAGYPLYFLIRKADNISNNDPFTKTALAKWFLDNNKPQEALFVINELVRVHSDFPPGLQIAAKTYLQNGQSEKAITVYRHLLEVYPGFRPKT